MMKMLVILQKKDSTEIRVETAMEMIPGKGNSIYHEGNRYVIRANTHHELQGNVMVRILRCEEFDETKDAESDKVISDKGNPNLFG